MQQETHEDEETKRLVEEEIGVRTLPDERIDEILESIRDMEVELAEDPLTRGPRFLIRQIARTRNYMSEVQKYREELQNTMTRLRRKLNNLSSEYEVRYNAIRIKDPDIQDFGASRDRDAACEYKLQDLKVKIDNVESEISELQSVMEAVNNRFEQLKQTGWDIRKQRDLIGDELEIMGVEWSEAPIDDITEDMSHEDIETTEEGLKRDTQLDIKREKDSPEESSGEENGGSDVTTDDLLEGVDTGQDHDKMEGPDLDSPGGDSEDSIQGSEGDDISAALEDIDVDAL